jgi:hypothetical protein
MYKLVGEPLQNMSYLFLSAPNQGELAFGKVGVEARRTREVLQDSYASLMSLTSGMRKITRSSAYGERQY